MESLRQIIHEIHSRSLWQVLGIFVAASWGVLQVVELLTETAGLPDWTPSMALVLLLIGLPICLATAFVQEGMPDGGGPVAPTPGDPSGASADPARTGPASPPGDAPAAHAPSGDHGSAARATSSGGPGPAIGVRRFLTWRNAVFGGIGALALLGFSVIAYLFMWSAGVGPVGNLQAQGLIDEGDPVLLADFENRTDDEGLGAVVTEALRVDLATSQVITLVEGTAVSEVLGLMGRPRDEPVRGEVANEVAVRGGYRAIVGGEVGSAGSGYILLASIRSAADGRTLATFRRTASDESGVIAAIDGLSQDIRERAGESLRSIRAGEPLEAVTTSSLEALRLFSASLEARETEGDARARVLVEEALRLDPEFAMAWRALAVLLPQTGGSREEERDAATRAYDLRHRLTERERYATIANYHSVVTGDIAAQIDAYETLLAAYPEDRAALNNLSIAYSDLTRWDEATALLQRAIDGPEASFSNYANRVLYTALSGDFEASHAALEELEAEYPQSTLWSGWGGFILAWSEWDAAEARRRAVVVQGVPDSPEWRRTGTRALALSYAIEGQAGAMRETFDGAVMEARRAGHAIDETQAWIDRASAEMLVGSGDPRPELRALLDGGALERTAPEVRNNVQLITLVAWAGLHDEARRLLEEWEDAASDLSAGSIGLLRALVDAMETGADDPAGAAAAVERLRTSTGCPRCGAWELGGLYERAGMLDEAIRERERSLEAGQDFYFALHRLAAHEALGRLHEERGDTARAVEHYTTYVEQLAAGADLPRVARARERLTALGATPSSRPRP